MNITKICKILIIFGLTILLSSNVLGQKSISKPTPKQQDINDFFTSFVKEMNQTGDIDKVPEKFFVSDFKNRFAEHDEWFIGVAETNANLFDKLTASERYKHNVSISNFFYLLLQCYYDKKRSLEGFDEEQNILQGLPNDILPLVKQSKWFKAVFDDNYRTIAATTLPELKVYITEMDLISEKIRKFLNHRSPAQKRKYDSVWTKNRKQQIINETNTSSDICEGENCLGLPEKTRIYALHAFSLCLRIAKIDNEFKIINIYCGFCED